MHRRQPPAKTPEELAMERRLSGSAFSRAADSSALSVPVMPARDEFARPCRPMGRRAGESGSSELSALLKPGVTPAVRARVLPTQRLLLPKGAFIDCTLETAIDSTLPGMTTCVTATDTFGVDGSTVLLERGTKLVGETRGQVQQGAARVFVLWSEARTPTGVVIPLASPGTDELGRSGLAGQVNRHFFERFGAAILISMIDGAVQGAVQSSGNGTVIYNPSAAEDIMTEVLKSTVNIPPTVTKAQGDRIQVLVARDLDFRTVYELRTVAMPDSAATTRMAQMAQSLKGAAEASALDLTLRALRPLLNDPEVTELCINRPGRGVRRDAFRLAAGAAAVCGLRVVPQAREAGRQLDPPAHRGGVAAAVGVAAEWRAHPDRAAAGDHRRVCRDHDPPAIGSGVEHRGSDAERHLPARAPCDGCAG